MLNRFRQRIRQRAAKVALVFLREFGHVAIRRGIRDGNHELVQGGMAVVLSATRLLDEPSSEVTCTFEVAPADVECMRRAVAEAEKDGWN